MYQLEKQPEEVECEHEFVAADYCDVDEVCCLKCGVVFTLHSSSAESFEDNYRVLPAKTTTMRLPMPAGSTIPKHIVTEFRHMYAKMKLQNCFNKRSIFAIALLIIIADKNKLKLKREEIELWKSVLHVRKSLRTHTLNLAINEVLELMNKTNGT